MPAERNASTVRRYVSPSMTSRSSPSDVTEDLLPLRML
jgi:hypothetical protein